MKEVTTITGKKIQDLEDLREYINTSEDWPNDVWDICESLGFYIIDDDTEIAFRLDYNQRLQFSSAEDGEVEVVDPFDSGKFSTNYAIVVSKDNGECYVESVQDINNIKSYLESRWGDLLDRDSKKEDTWVRVFDLTKQFYIAHNVEDLPFYDKRVLIEYANCEKFANILGGPFAGFIKEAQVYAFVCNYDDLGII